MQKHIALLLLSSFFIYSCTDPSVELLRAELNTLKADKAKADVKLKLSGVIRDKITTQPVKDVKVKLNGETRETDSDGAYHFKNIEPGESKMIVTKIGYLNLEQTLNFEQVNKVHDMDLTPDPTQQSSPTPLPPIEATPLPTVSAIPLPASSSPTTSESPQPSASPISSASPLIEASPSPSVSASPTPLPTPSPTPLYDPQLDKAKRIDVLASKKSNGLSLNFVLQDENAVPISWGHGAVKVEYFVVEAVDNQGEFQKGQLISSGSTQIGQSNDAFVVSLAPSQITLIQSKVHLTITITLPDQRQLRRNDFFSVF